MSEYRSEYDRGGDILSIVEEGSTIRRSIKIGDITLDFDADGRVVGVEALNASENIMLPEDVEEDPADLLSRIVRADMDVNYRENSITVVATLVMSRGEAPETEIQGRMQTPSPVVSPA